MSKYVKLSTYHAKKFFNYMSLHFHQILNTNLNGLIAIQENANSVQKKFNSL